MKKIYVYITILAVAAFLPACGKKKVDTTVPASKVLSATDTVEPVEQTPSPTPSAVQIAPKVTKEEAKVIAKEQEKVVEQAKQQEEAAEKEVAKKVVTSSVAESAPIPDGFPVQNVPIIQGAQIVSASKSDNTYHMVLRVNVTSKDAYKHYFDLYDAVGSVKISSKVENSSLIVERAKSGLYAEFTFADENETTSTITIKAMENQ